MGLALTTRGRAGISAAGPAGMAGLCEDHLALENALHGLKQRGSVKKGRTCFLITEALHRQSIYVVGT